MAEPGTEVTDEVSNAIKYLRQLQVVPSLPIDSSAPIAPAVFPLTETTLALVKSLTSSQDANVVSSPETLTLPRVVDEFIVGIY